MDLRRTPLYEEHVALGARMVVFAGWEMPVRYSGIIEEHKAVRRAAGVFDVCHMSEFRVFGFGALEFLQSELTNDLVRISEIGRAQYTLLCDEDGGIIDDLIVYHSGDLEYLIVASAGNHVADVDRFTASVPGDVEFADESERTGMIALQGPLACGILSDLADKAFDLPPRFAIGEAAVCGIPVLVARTGYTGEDGVELLCHTGRVAELWRVLLSVPEITPCGLGARDTLRLEMGYPLHGSDMDRGVDPVSAGLSRAVALDKGPFTGRDAIAAIASAGPARRLVGLRVEGGIPRPGHPVLHAGEEVGKVASGTYSPTLEVGIATAYVPSALAEPGTGLEVVIRSRIVPAVVERPPFVKMTSLSAGG